LSYDLGYNSKGVLRPLSRLDEGVVKVEDYTPNRPL